MEDKKLKVGLISFHNALNYGAAMQAFGLQEALKEMGVEPEYINYVNKHRRYMYDTSYQIFDAIKRRNIVRAIRLSAGAGFIFARRRRFRTFYAKHLIVTKEIYQTSQEATVLNGVYDKFVVGSDQVWNWNNNGGDAAYLLDFVNTSDKKISYASSFGMAELPEKSREVYSSSLSKIGRIGVREETGAKLIKKYSGRESHVVLDPVFLAGLKTWDALRQEGTTTDEEYVFFYVNRKSQIRDFWNIGYPKEGLKSHVLSSFVGVRDFLNPDLSVRVAMPPADFINEIVSAKLVVTASFHCVAFSILYHKQFIVFLTGNRGKDERIINLLHICGLESRIVRTSTTTNDINEIINYDVVDKRLQPYLEYSWNYLFNAIYSLSDEKKLSLPSGESNYFCNDERCSGCMACLSACPVNAISVQINQEGFCEPIRDEKICIDCFKCHDVCQVLKPLQENMKEQMYFAVKNTDEVRKKSSSGGVFSALSDEIIRMQGVICAATMVDEFHVRHMFAETREERDKMCETFYVQSDLSDVHVKIEYYLKNGRNVLFVGTPCQVAGLRKYLFGKDIDKLYTCDLICHGVPSPGVFNKFIDYLKCNYPGLKEFHFRDKEFGWKHGYTVSVRIQETKKHNTLQLQSFNKMFSRNMINRQSCANCLYTNYERVGDITIGDCWSIKNTAPHFSDKLGVSLVMLNSKKGEELFRRCKDLSTLRLDKSQTRQNSLIKQAEPSVNRMHVFWIFHNYGYKTLAQKYGEVNTKGIINKSLRTVIRK